MMQAVRSTILFAAVAIVVTLYGFATPALAHGGHNALPAAQAAHTTNYSHDVGTIQSTNAEVANMHQDGAKSDVATCCGLSCMLAVPQYDPQLLIIELHHSSLLPPLHPKLLGRGPARLDRPPTA
jgi:hypothetical protein